MNRCEHLTEKFQMYENLYFLLLTFLIVLNLPISLFIALILLLTLPISLKEEEIETLVKVYDCPRDKIIEAVKGDDLKLRLKYLVFTEVIPIIIGIAIVDVWSLFVTNKVIPVLALPFISLLIRMKFLEKFKKMLET